MSDDNFKKGELGSSEKPFKSIEEVTNYSKVHPEKLKPDTSESVPITDVRPQKTKMALLIAISGMKDGIHKKILSARIQGVTVERIARYIIEPVNKVIALERAAMDVATCSLV